MRNLPEFSSAKNLCCMVFDNYRERESGLEIKQLVNQILVVSLHYHLHLSSVRSHLLISNSSFSYNVSPDNEYKMCFIAPQIYDSSYI